MEVRALHAGQQTGDRGRGTVAPIGKPALHLLEAVVPHVRHGARSHLAQWSGVKAVGAAEGGEQGFALLVGPIALGEAVEYLGEPHGEQAIGLEALLVAQQVQLHQQFVHQAAVEGGDHMGKRRMKGPLAVGNGLAGAHAQGFKVARP